MKVIALFGGTGFVGERLAKQLLAADYRISMLVRDPEQAATLASPPSIHTVCGSIEDIDAVNATLTGCDACIVATGARSNSRGDREAIVQGTKNVITAMQAQRIKRLIKLSGVSVRIAGEPFPLPRRLLDIGLKLAMPNPSKSKYLEQQLIEPSGLDWVVVRPPVIEDKPINKPFTAHSYQYLGLKVALDDLCQFMVEQLEDDRWLQQCPVVGYR